MTYVGLGFFVRPFPVLAFFDKLAVPNPEHIYVPPVARSSTSVKQAIKYQVMINKNSRDQPHRVALRED